LQSLGLKPNDNIGLFSINRLEWVVAEQACFHQSLVTVPLYDTLGADAIEYIVQSATTSLVVATADKAHVLLKIASKLTALKHIVVMDSLSSELAQLAKSKNVAVHLMSDLENKGSEDPKAPIGITGDTIATICYTSGTTGLPKGVLLTHTNIISFVGAYQHFIKHGEGYNITSADTHISYLPLAHIFERVLQAFFVNVGARIGFFQGDTLKLLDDVGVLKPTVFASVPRLYNRIFDKIQAGVRAKGGVAQFLFEHALASKKAFLKKGYYSHLIYDALVFKAVRARLGGNVRFMVSGAAPLSGEVADFLRVCFSVDFAEGYGQTESAAQSTLQILSDLSSGHVGVPAPSCEIKLRDVPSMNYTSQDKPNPRGEIMVRGPAVFKGYYKSPEKTAETITKDGWLLTGDVGMWDSQGRLRIIDRVKK
jgi:long-chain acyl-CoA synthetase